MQRWQKELKKFYEEGYRFVPLTAEDLQPESEKVSEAIEKWDEFLSRYASELDTTETTVIESSGDLGFLHPKEPFRFRFVHPKESPFRLGFLHPKETPKEPLVGRMHQADVTAAILHCHSR